MTLQNIQESVDFLTAKGIKAPTVAIVLGTGLGKLTDKINITHEIDYTDIPHFVTATLESHAGKLIFGTLAGKDVVVMNGRFHLYEGYNFNEITYGVRVMKALSANHLLISNAAGAINLNFNKGELMLIDDHINLQGGSPLAFKNAKEFGNIFVDMSAPYNKKLNSQLESIAGQNNINLHKGVYASVVGPQLETRAEYKYLKIIGADAVGMSTVPEVIVANQIGLPCVAISVLTDECDPKNLKPINIPEIFEMAAKAEPMLITLFTKLIEQL
ncbi:purine-nucleoside phosphorylase [Wenyingzhuangia fucanilytica]|uniref:Purine nucleoside phosphorylase n=1 Tax=Wenyingzhuangia fucanilytica TaxID=1790137 RepID=A0A1B1Y7Y2_9FLAO|nr:purine-nucleoside phosphorylase [Wenyingzhuangia fucanilytica]ANW96875.1 purine-nucleoside phosphorylase [Wenyingzhuangia fucanilytica]